MNTFSTQKPHKSIHTIKSTLLTCFLFCILVSAIPIHALTLTYFNQFRSYTPPINNDSTKPTLFFLLQRWNLNTNSQGTATGQSASELKLTRKAVVYPNPFKVTDRPRIQLAIPNDYVDNLPHFEVRIYDTRGFELLRKHFRHQPTQVDSGFKYSRNTQSETYINLEFTETDLKNKLSTGGYLYLLFMNDKIIQKGKMAVKASN